MTNTTIQGNKGTIEIRTRKAGSRLLAQAFLASVGKTPIWQEDFVADASAETIEAACRAYLTDNTSMLDGVA